MHLSLALAVVSTLGYLVYRDATSAIIITLVFGPVSMVINLAFLDLAAGACPARVEATVFAALTSVYNLGAQLSENVGARLYDVVGYVPLVYIAAGMTALTWVLMPLVKFDQIDAKVRDEAAAGAETAVTS